MFTISVPSPVLVLCRHSLFQCQELILLKEDGLCEVQFICVKACYFKIIPLLSEYQEVVLEPIGSPMQECEGLERPGGSFRQSRQGERR